MRLYVVLEVALGQEVLGAHVALEGSDLGVNRSYVRCHLDFLLKTLAAELADKWLGDVLLVMGAFVDSQLIAKGKAPAADLADKALVHVHSLAVLLQVTLSVEVQLAKRAAKPASIAHLMIPELMCLQGVICAKGVLADFTFKLLSE